MIIDIQAKSKLKKLYSKEIQSHFKTSSFGAIANVSTIDKRLLDEIVNVVNAKILLVSSMVFAVRSACYKASLRLITIKLITVFVIFYRSAY